MCLTKAWRVRGGGRDDAFLTALLGGNERAVCHAEPLLNHYRGCNQAKKDDVD